MGEKDLNINQVTTEASLTNGLLNKSFKVGKHLRSDTIASICRAYPELDPTWLLLGEGNMYRDGPGRPDIEHLDKEEMIYYAGSLERRLRKKMEPIDRLKELMERAEKEGARQLREHKRRRRKGS